MFNLFVSNFHRLVSVGMAFACCLTQVALLSSCLLSSRRGPPVSASERTWDKLDACAEQARENALRANCAERFKDTEVTAELTRVDLVAGSISLDLVVSHSTYGARHLTCMLDGVKYKEQASKLSRGDRVTVRGTPSRVYSSLYFTDIVFDPCELVSSTRRPPE